VVIINDWQYTKTKYAFLLYYCSFLVTEKKKIVTEQNFEVTFSDCFVR